MWAFNPETKAKFAQKNVKKNGYVEGLEQIENTPEIAVVEWEEEVQPVLEPEKGKANRMRKSAAKEKTMEPLCEEEALYFENSPEAEAGKTRHTGTSGLRDWLQVSTYRIINQ